ncbi:MAG: hypothetical protein ACFE94_09315 [Candidatus Hodarchaeota archaeon]
MAKIEVRCPICSNWDNIEISDDATRNATKGLLAINITAGMICEHNFIAYVDKNLIVRDCLIADFKIEAPESPGSTTREDTDKIIPEVESINHDLIKLNIPEPLMASILRAIFLGKGVILISDDQYLADNIIYFFKYAMKNLFDNEIIAMSKSDYNHNQINYEKYIVFEKRKIVQDFENLINPKKIDIEKGIAKKFLEEYDLITALIILRNEIQKAFEFSKTLAEFITNSEKKAWTSKILLDHVNKVYNERIQINYLIFLYDIVHYYFKVDIPKIEGVTKFLGIL